MTRLRDLCTWCDQPFQPGRRGSPRRFCSARCRTMFWSALRRLGARAITDGIVVISDLRKGTAEACTLATCQGLASPPADKRPADPALLAALRRVGAVKGIISVAPEGLVELVRLGWLDRHSCRHPRVIGDAITDLANAALDAGLRPLDD
jgi:hypothetical protein